MDAKKLKRCDHCGERVIAGTCACNRSVARDPQTRAEIAARAAQARAKFADPAKKMPGRAERYDERPATEMLAADAAAETEREMARRRKRLQRIDEAEKPREESPVFGWLCPVHRVKLEVYRTTTLASSRRRHYRCPRENCPMTAHTTENFDYFATGSAQGPNAD